MEDQIKSVESTSQKESNGFQSTESQISSQMNKTYDDCDVQKGVISILMKIVPIIIYLTIKLLTDQCLTLFVFTTIALAIDFWTTKNILGPRLVGLKWFSASDQNQNQKWYFASCSQTRVINFFNQLFFWAPQIFAILFWFIIIFFNIVTLGLFWIGLAIFSSALLIINFIFFIQCKGDHQKKVNFLAKKLGFKLYNDQAKSSSFTS